MSLITLEDARDALKIGDFDTSVDQMLQGFVDAITKVVENHVSEVIEQREITERLRLRGNNTFTLGSVPIISLTSITGLRGEVLDVAGMDVDPITGTVEVFRGAAPVGTFVAVYNAGYAAPPDNYKQGGLVILEHIWETQRGAGGVMAGVIGEEERMNRLWMYGIPRKALEWLGPPAPGVA